MTQAETFRFKEILESKRLELASSIHVQTAALAVGENEHDPIDHVQSMNRREESATQVAWLSRTLAQVDRSLEAISDGSYGLCLDCKEPIGLKRLAVIPWASLCLGCQQRLELLGTEDRQAA